MTNAWKLAALLGVLCCGAVLVAEEPTIRSSKDYLQATSKVDRRDLHLRSQLNAGTKMAFIDTPLVEVAQYLKTLHDIDIQIHERALEGVGLGLDVPVTIHLEHVSLRSGLRLLLSQLELTYRIEDGRLIITTPEEAEDHLKTVFYPCRELIFVEGPQASSDDHPDYDSLINLITTIIQPESWSEGGPYDSIQPTQNGIVVSQTEDIQADIAGLFAALLAAKSLPDDGYDPTAIDVNPAGETSRRKLAASLNKPGSRRFVDTPLEEVVAVIAEWTGSPVIIDRRSLEDVGVAIDLPITCDIVDGSARDLLRRLQRETELTYSLTNEAIVILTQEAAESNMSTKVYPVRDLVGPQFVPNRIEPTGFGSTSASEGFRFQRYPRDYDSLLSAIASIDFDLWEDNGGPGSIQMYDNSAALVVTQTEPVHEKVAALLREIRRDRQAEPIPAAEVEAKRNAAVWLRYPIPLDDESEDALGTLARVLAAEVAPETWNNQTANMEKLGKRVLLIKQTPLVHAMIRERLGQLYPRSEYADRFGGAVQGGFGQPVPGGFGGGGFGGGFGGGGVPAGGGFFSVPNRQE
ncbi:DUF4974 domain-containing protein [Blastopirellula marina]|uniref:DUF4974 domain-containing protein n=1 Tax=Blastopirellula marina TaxID=124 RepID=UPI0018EA498E|nr:DUF4974 domain-containing protein [Blastopirellula marina]